MCNCLYFQRLRQIGCFVTTSETVIFKILRDKDHPKFPEIRHLVKEASPDTGLLVSTPSTSSLTTGMAKMWQKQKLEDGGDRTSSSKSILSSQNQQHQRKPSPQVSSAPAISTAVAAQPIIPTIRGNNTSKVPSTSAPVSIPPYSGPKSTTLPQTTTK